MAALSVASLGAATYMLTRALKLPVITGWGAAIIAGGAADIISRIEWENTPIQQVAGIGTMLAGLYGHWWSIVFGLIHISATLHATQPDQTRHKHKWVTLAAITFAASLTSHLTPAFFVGAASLATILTQPKTQWKQTTKTVTTGLLAGTGLAAIWLLPLLTRLEHTFDMSPPSLTHRSFIIGAGLAGHILLATIGTWWLWKQNRKALIPLLTWIVLPVTMFYLSVGQSALRNNRTIYMYYYMLAILAGIGFITFTVATVQAAKTKPTKLLAAAMFLAVLALYLYTVGSWLKPFAAHVMSGATHQNEINNITTELRKHPPGRVGYETSTHWLFSNGIYDTPMLIPYWAGENYPIIHGLLPEGSITAPYSFKTSAACSHYNPWKQTQTYWYPVQGRPYTHTNPQICNESATMFAMNYFITHTPESDNLFNQLPNWEPAAQNLTCTIYDRHCTYTIWVNNNQPQLVETAQNQPWVHQNGTEPGLLKQITAKLAGNPENTFNQTALTWYNQWEERPELPNQWVTQHGPDHWHKTDQTLTGQHIPLNNHDTIITNIETGHNIIRFTTNKVGEPHRIKTSWFPNWKAYGADGPWQVTPSFMLVIPTQKNVELKFEDTWAETLGKTITALTALTVTGHLTYRIRKQRHRPEDPKPADPRSESDNSETSTTGPENTGTTTN